MGEMLKMIVSLIGGLGLFLYGMKLMGDGLENAAGDKLKIFFKKITSNPVKGILTGALVTAIINSSSATTVMVVGFVNAGMMTLMQAAGVIMGANIGTTITGQLVAFNLSEFAPVFIGIGVAIVLFAKAKKSKEIGNIILGFGILFMGMSVMSSAMKPLGDSDAFKQLILTIGRNPIVGVLVGLAMTATIQSSAATIGILMGLAANGAIPLSVAIPILFGDNIGTCATTLISTIGTNKTAKKAALIHVSFNVIGTIIFMFLLTPFSHIVSIITPGNINRQIANAHTLFNVANTIIQAPLIKYLVAFVNKIIPGEDEYEKMGTKFIDDRLLETPVIAVGQASKEISRMANKSKENFATAFTAFKTGNNELIDKVYETEKLINLLEDEITEFLVKLSNAQLAEDQVDIVTSMFHVVNDIERIGDHAENLADLAAEVIQKKIYFSEDALKELEHMYSYTLNAVEISVESFEQYDKSKAQDIINIEARIDSLEKELRDSHIRRLNSGRCFAQNGTIFMDIISNFERIGDHATNIAESVLNL